MIKFSACFSYVSLILYVIHKTSSKIVICDRFETLPYFNSQFRSLIVLIYGTNLRMLSKCLETFLVLLYLLNRFYCDPLTKLTHILSYPRDLSWPFKGFLCKNSLKFLINTFLKEGFIKNPLLLHIAKEIIKISTCYW